MHTITEETLERLKTPAGGYNEATMTILNCWPLTAGWREWLIGRQISDRKLKEAIAAAARGKKHIFRGNTRRRR